MTPEQLIDSIRIKRLEMAFENKPYDDYDYAEASLRIVLQAIKDGEVVDLEYIEGCAEDTYKIVLKPDFEKWMENK